MHCALCGRIKVPCQLNSRGVGFEGVSLCRDACASDPWRATADAVEWDAMVLSQCVCVMQSPYVILTKNIFLQRVDLVS